MLNLMKVCPVGARVFHADVHHEINISFPQFCEKRLKTIARGICSCLPSDLPVTISKLLCLFIPHITNLIICLLAKLGKALRRYGI